ncbi:MAG: peptidoglycan editing factor PgeF [Prevotella sp.]|nr:peptidoglycan editing factor PgeF [Prevotella sp.]
MMTYHSLPDGVVAFSTTRHGGVSQGKYASFNVNPYCGDEPDAVATNKELLAKELGIAKERVVMPHQTHGLEVKPILPTFFDETEEYRNEYLESVDALMTDMCGVCIGVSTADCIPVLLYDSAHQVVSAIHAGWRGTVGRIVQKTIQEMQKTYTTEPQNIHAIIGPGISLENFEVGDEVYKSFCDAGFDMDSIAKRYPATSDGGEGQVQKWHIDLWECNRQQLYQAGVSLQNIQVTGICTYANVQDYFSARRLGIDSGRIFTGIMMKER